jgi:glutamate racemase
MWTICIFFTLRSSIWLMAVGMFIYLCLIPVVEAAEQTILQNIGLIATLIAMRSRAYRVLAQNYQEA